MPSPRPPTRRSAALVTRFVVPVLVFALGIGVFAALQATKPDVARATRDTPPPEALVFIAEPIAVHRPWRGYGTAEAEVAADVPARVSATVSETPDWLQEGVAVEAGQVLARLDPTDFERRVEQAEQTLAAIDAQRVQLAAEAASLRERLPIEDDDVRIAEREAARVGSVVERGAGNQQDLDAAERNLLAAKRNRWQVTQQVAQLDARQAALDAQRLAQESALRSAREDLARTTIVSPIDGIVQSVSVKVGENVRAGDPIARVANLGLIEAPVRLPSSARGTVAPGDVARLMPPGQPDVCWNARVERLSPQDDPVTRTMTAYLVVDQRGGPADAKAGLLHPGRFVEAAIASAAAEERWVLPRRSVRAGRAYLVDDAGVVTSVAVTADFALQGDFAGATGLADDQWVALVPPAGGDPLPRGARVLVNASTAVRDGGRVTPVLVGDGAPAAELDASPAGIAHHAGGPAPAGEGATP